MRWTHGLLLAESDHTDHPSLIFTCCVSQEHQSSSVSHSPCTPGSPLPVCFPVTFLVWAAVICPAWVQIPGQYCLREICISYRLNWIYRKLESNHHSFQGLQISFWRSLPPRLLPVDHSFAFLSIPHLFSLNPSLPAWWLLAYSALTDLF